MNAKEYLNQYREANRKVRQIEIELVELQSSYDQIRSVTDYDGLPHGSNIGHPTEEKAIRVADKRLEYIEILNTQIAKRQRVFDTILKVDGVEADVLYYRYIKLLDWVDIPELIGYEWAQMHRYHQLGLIKVEELLKHDTK